VSACESEWAVMCATHNLLKLFRSGKATWNQRTRAGNETTGDVAFEGEYYYLVHFSRFVRPGAQRIAVETGVSDLQTIGFRTPEGRIVLVAMNTGDDDLEVRVTEGPRSFKLCVPAHGIVTGILERNY